MFHALAAGPDGQLYLVWQGFRGGQSDILLKRFNGITWQSEQRISTDPANDWRPALSVDRGGRVGISWDSSADGDYDVRIRPWYTGGLGPPNNPRSLGLPRQ